ncbi:hypothetical protein H5T55_05910 [Candidatus Bipolaricaulota bacterium]|nr:hypothetical protein [Candidatus Bipolaricaulota bacterium]
MRRRRSSSNSFFASLGRAMLSGCLVLGPMGGVCGAELVSNPRVDAGTCWGGACSVGAERAVFYDSSYGGAGLPVEVRYPSSPDGAVAAGVFPLVVFGHGYQQSYADYAYVWEDLVPHGYILAFPDKLSASAAIGMDAYARDLRFVAGAMRALAGDPASRYFGRIADETALVGHSTGGGAALVAASQSDGVTHPGRRDKPDRCGAGRARPRLDPRRGRGLRHPDVGPQPGDLRQPPLPELPRDGSPGRHCGFSDARGPGQGMCAAAERAACAAGLPLLGPRGPTLGSEGQNAVTVAYLVPWLAFHLQGDVAAWSEFLRRLDTDPHTAYEGRP